LREGYFDNPAVTLVGDEDMGVREPGALHRRIQLVGTRAGLSEPAVLPNDSAGGVHEDNAVVGGAGGGLRDPARGCAGAGHQGELPDALSVVDADDRLGRKVVRPEPERPKDVARLADFNDAIVELVGD